MGLDPASHATVAAGMVREVLSGRAAGEDGILYASVRRRSGTNAVAYRPTKVLDIVQTDHFSIRVTVADRRIEVHRLASA